MEIQQTRIKQLVAKHFTEYSNNEIFQQVTQAFIKEFTDDFPNLENLIKVVSDTLSCEQMTAKGVILELLALVVKCIHHKISFNNELLALVVKCIHHKISFNNEEFTDERIAFVKIYRKALMSLSRSSTFLSYIAQFDTYFARHLISSDFQFEMESKIEPQIEIRWRMKMDDGEEREVMLSPAIINKMVEETGAALQAIDSIKRRHYLKP
ncbi:unnamed protein product, partial [Mesorhabditis belari]|uniref:COMM domain-containing protein n=1 Tax=Mesorhabditis belari TaxID=2138241 RepID=A0AAF3FKJ3_9BILA